MTPPHRTSLTLLGRIKANEPDAWTEFVESYGPVITRWLSRFELSDPDDIKQEVLLAVFRSIGRFDRRCDGSFRRWLRIIARNRALASLKKRRDRQVSAADQRVFDQLIDDSSDPSKAWDAEHEGFLLRQVLDEVESDLGDTAAFRAFVRFAFEREPATEVAISLGVSVGYVYLSKHRVTMLIRQKLTWYLD